jgi:hypothetical protein
MELLTWRSGRARHRQPEMQDMKQRLQLMSQQIRDVTRVVRDGFLSINQRVDDLQQSNVVFH